MSILNRLVIRPTNTDDPIPANTYEFGVAPITDISTHVTDWRTSNVFNVVDGAYYFAVRRIDSHIVVRDDIVLMYSLNLEKAIAIQGLLDRLNQPLLLTVTVPNQATFPLSDGEDRKSLYLFGNKCIYGSDFTISGNVLRWINSSIALQVGWIFELTY